MGATTDIDDNDLDWAQNLANKIGSPEAAIRLLLTICAGYPIALIYRGFIRSIPILNVHHLFFALTGSGLCYFNYGVDTYHSLVAICTSYILMHLFYKSSTYLIATNFTFHMGYLLTGYYFTESSDYDILWTMPHCVLVLRMIGFAFDVADGQKPHDKLSKDQQECALRELPTLLELLAFSYFPASFLVGPQFPFRRYRRFINREFVQYKGSVQEGMKRLSLGLIYLGIRQVGTMMLPDDYFLTDAYANQRFLRKIFYMGLWGKFSLYKYISCWLMTEGALMCLGFTYNGDTLNGKPDWYGCSNVKLLHLETGTCMQHYVQSFNVNTNLWVAQYIYKRLKFLNNRTISYGGALGFLAVWHGFHSGYYMSFLLEYIVVTAEKQIEEVYTKSVVPHMGTVVESSWYSYLKLITLKLYNIVFMGFCLTPFIFLSYERWIQVFHFVDYYGFIWLSGWLIFYFFYKYSHTDNTKKSSHSIRKGEVFSKATDLSPTVGAARYDKNSMAVDANFSQATDLSPTFQSNKKNN
uniref:Lysophospholipid acyltransferase 5 n=1 Tax=Glossina pallidipes TaxID=7398 RepID=A0A1B0AI88_GLOPL